MKKILLSIVFVLPIFSAADNAVAQQRFKAGLILGLNASQIMGDDIAGYNKLGVHGGLRATAVLKDKQDLSIELLYSQKGSYSKNSISGDFIKIKLDYVEVPVLFSYKDWYKEEAGYYKVQVIGGLSYGRLIRSSAEGSKYDDLVDDFNSSDIGLTIGLEYFTSKHFGFGFRWSRSLNLLYNNKNTPGRNSLYSYFLSFRGMYIF